MDTVKLLHEDAAVRLHCGDALDTPCDVQADAFLIDPPWSRTGGAHTSNYNPEIRAARTWESDQFWAYWFTDIAERTTAATKSAGHGFVFCDYRTIHLVERCLAAKGRGWVVSQALIWDRDSTGLGSPFRASHEMIAFARGPDFKWTGRKDLRNVIRYRWPYGEHPNHEAEKPVDLLVKLMTEYSDAPPGSLWLDNFMGSATSAVAAARCGRRLWGGEKSEERAAMAVKRYLADTSQIAHSALGA